MLRSTERFPYITVYSPHEVLCASGLVPERIRVLLPTNVVEKLIITRAAGHFRFSVALLYECIKHTRSAAVVVQQLHNIVV